jgi:uncharacterized protein YrrD
MYESFGRLKGKKVCGSTSGKYFGRLSDIIVNKGTNKIAGIVSEKDSFMFHKRFFKSSDIESVDNLHVYVSGDGEKFSNDAKYQSVGNDIYRRNAVLSDGREAGKIQNINLNLESGTITGFEIGSSIADDLLEGRKICRTRNTIKTYCGNVILHDEPK